MAGESGPTDLGALRDELERGLDTTDDLTEEMLEVAAIVGEAVEPLDVHPIVVGGLAVAYWAPGGHVTYDIDVVMPWAPAIEEALEALGFERDGRFWVIPGRQVFFESPGGLLEPNVEGYELVELASGRTVRVQSPEEVLLLRLKEFVGTGHADVFQQCLWLVGSSALDGAKLKKRADEEGLKEALEALNKQADQIRAGARTPETWELKDIARRLDTERGK